MSNKKRIIVDLGFPPSKSVNAIEKGFYLGQHFNFSLPSVSLLTDRLIELGHGFGAWTLLGPIGN